MAEMSPLMPAVVHDAAVRIIFYGIIIILAILALSAIMLVLRWWFFKRTAGGLQGWSVDDIEALRRCDRLSEDEFISLRRIALGLGSGEKEETLLSSQAKNDDSEQSTD